MSENTKTSTIGGAFREIADAIRQKSSSTDLIPVSEMKQRILDIETPLEIVNGTIEEYKAKSDEIKPGTFVEITNRGVGLDKGWLYKNIAYFNQNPDVKIIDSARLTDTKFILALDNYNSTGWNYASAMIIEITESGIVTGDKCNLCSYDSTFTSSPRVVALTDSTAVAFFTSPAYKDGDDTEYAVYLRISEKTITVLKSVYGCDFFCEYTLGAYRVTDDTVAVVHAYYSSSYYGLRSVFYKYTNDGYDNVAVTRSTEINCVNSSTGKSAWQTCIVPNSDNKILILSENTIKYATLSDDLKYTVNKSLNIGTPTYNFSSYVSTLSNNWYTQFRINAIKIRDNTFLVSQFSGYNGLRLCIVKVSDGGITQSPFLEINEFGYEHTVSIVDDNTVYIAGVFVAYKTDDKAYGGILIDVSKDDAVTVIDSEYIKKEFTTTTPCHHTGLYLSNEMITSVMLIGSYITCYSTCAEKCVAPAATKIDGIARTKILPDTPGQVYIPRV